MSVYAVVDTNVIVSAFITKHDDAATVKVWRELSGGLIKPVYNDDILAEYTLVLKRPKFHLKDEKIEKILRTVQSFGLELEPLSTTRPMVDAKDQIFYDTMMTYRHKSAYLVTGNKKHFPHEDYIVTPAEMMDILANS